MLYEMRISYRFKSDAKVNTSLLPGLSGHRKSFAMKNLYLGYELFLRSPDKFMISRNNIALEAPLKHREHRVIEPEILAHGSAEVFPDLRAMLFKVVEGGFQIVDLICGGDHEGFPAGCFESRDVGN